MTNFTDLAVKIAEKLQSGQIVGVGTGSTVAAVVPEIAKRVNDQNMNVSFVSTSQQTTEQLNSFGLRVLEIASVKSLDWGFDGADAVNEQKQAIKGKGAAMLREKVMAKLCQSYSLVVDQSKLAKNIASHSAVPVEFIPEAVRVVEAGLKSLDIAELELRMAVKKHGPVVTEKGHLIYDVKFNAIQQGTEEQIKSIVGVVESGLFYQYADEVLVAEDSGVRIF